MKIFLHFHTRLHTVSPPHQYSQKATLKWDKLCVFLHLKVFEIPLFQDVYYQSWLKDDLFSLGF